MKHIYLLFVAMLVFSCLATSQNLTVESSVNDTISADVTWDYDTVFMDASLYILDDVVLTISPGTRFIFNDYYRIDVEGSVISEGTETDTIFYTVADTTGYSADYSHAGWEGFEFDNDGSMDDNMPSGFAYCHFSYANSSDDGGVFKVEEYNDLQIVHSVFLNNYSNYYGGAIQFYYCLGGYIDHCQFINNFCNYRGGAIDFYDCSNVLTVSNCIFDGNHANNVGGAIKAGGYGTVRIINNVFMNNSSEDHGGAIMSSGYSNNLIIGNLFLNNHTDQHGGAIKVAYYASTIIANNTIVNNTADYGGGGLHCGYYNGLLTMKNNIFHNNTDSTSSEGNLFLYFGDGRTANLSNNIIGGGFDGICLNESDYVGTFENNMDTIPGFVDYPNGDYTTDCSSPGLNQGIIFPELTEYDMMGTDRIIGASVDIGYNETVSISNITSQPENITTCAGTEVNYSVVADMASGYQWEVSTDFGDSWTALSDDAVYTGTTSENLSVMPGVPLNGSLYRCIVSGPCEDRYSEDVFLLVNALPTVNLGPDVYINNAQSTTLDAGMYSAYEWSNGETSQTTTIDGSVLGAGDFTYSVTVTDAYGCQNSDEIEVHIEDVSGIASAGLKAVSVYPNPSSGTITITAPAQSDIEIIDLNGKLIMLKNSKSNGSTSVDLSDLDAGMYYIRITNKDEFIMKKVMLK
ncbi:MAG TPA: T9SS type A sorting domain-containing protein [Bacteroidales bacterium]|nr:T9SS type A sorting domain-containing protein [Bacteroidales bacterium]